MADTDRVEHTSRERARAEADLCSKRLAHVEGKV
jgi:hypothetical protein